MKKGIGPAEGSRRRRPSGEPPPLPRAEHLAPTMWALAVVLAIGALVAVVCGATDTAPTLGEGILDAFADVRTAALTDAARVVDALTSFTAVIVLRTACVVVLLATRR